MILTYTLFIIGFVILIKGADLLIEGASSIAKRFNVSDLVIGLTIVAFGTSAPELMVNVLASYQGNSELAIANVLGSNIANVLLGLGLAAFISVLVVKRNTVIQEIPLSFLAAIVVGLLANDILIDGALVSYLSRIDGLILLCFFTIFFAYTIKLATSTHEEPIILKQEFSLGRSVIEILLGLVGLTLGGDWIVNGAVQLATTLGMSQALIGLTIVAVGTSLPEIVTCVVSAKKGKADIAIGNVVGSNIFNVFWVLGISATIRPLVFDPKINADVIMHMVATGLLFLFLYFRNQKHILQKKIGVIFILIYIGYITFSVLRG